MIIKRKLYSKIKGLPKVVRDTRYLVGGKSPKAARKAVELGRKTENAGIYLRTTPGEKMVGDFMGFASKKPVQAVASALTFPTSGAIIEGALQRIGPYKKLTGWTGQQYEKHLRKPVENIAKSVIHNMPW